MKTDELKKYNLDENGKIICLPSFLTVSQLVSDFSDNNILLEEEQTRDLKYNLHLKVINAFDNVLDRFKTNEKRVELYKNTYDITDENNIFFLENSSGKVFYLRPLQMLSIFDYTINYLHDRLFTNSMIVKEMTDEEEDNFFDMLAKDEKEAELFRNDFYTDLTINSSNEILTLSSSYILEAISSAFGSRINKRNYNGNEQLNNEILEYIKNSEDLLNMVTLKR